MPTTCNHCGKPFNTSAVHPRRYCSIACEEGRGPRAQSDPASPDFWLHVQGNPETLVGRALVARGLKFCDYSPDWHRPPERYDVNDIVSIDREEQEFVRHDDVYLGRVAEYDGGEYVIEHEDMETGEITHRRVDDSMVLSLIRQDTWWVDG